MLDERGPNLGSNSQVRRKDGAIQFGLTQSEIAQLWDRMQSLLGKIDDGDYGLF